MHYVINRLKEASTWAGVAIFFGMFGLSGETIVRITDNGPALITAVASLLAIFAPNVLGKPVDNPVQEHGMN